MLAVDHCHTTGLIRGLLCFNCNAALGLLKDNTDTIGKLLFYLQKERKPTDVDFLLTNKEPINTIQLTLE